ncbi:MULTISPECIES: NAD(P)-dependent oxidoreductase [unclassified Rathayibacter]|uniref:NAD(P)-dependent oxidoreductase n=1 Tax=unclassified Rathayibacter TaxID=2609250 RepID=UPI000F4B5628|nr:MULTISPECIES: NAD(P)-dependent oxidoreductase [unclassified Rathayibacter]ROP49095.1 phosphoglycerate dehydrogenase-like enzyme [Rathayibacter sp. PhB186]ROS50788.1 phosphoglycerate dehydrogenase-like enzyme [Rathayibacter sp. PhB185]
MTTTVTAPTIELTDALALRAPTAEVLHWDLTGPAPAERIDMVIAPYMAPAADLAPVAESDVDVLHLQSIGYDGVAAVAGASTTICNAAGAHEEATAELALALILASRRGLPGFLQAQNEERWEQRFTLGLRGQRAVVVGAGGIGTAVTRMLTAFGVQVIRVGRSSRTDAAGDVVERAGLEGLLPEADVLVLAVPLDDSTRGLVDAAFLAALPDSALVVNVARGPVVVTEALIAELRTGRLHAALDVTDPEPLPAGHPLWTCPNTLIAPHVGGRVSTMQADLVDLLSRQIHRLESGETLLNVVAGAPRS